MKVTKARKVFKKRFGQVNHLLITSLIGLDALQDKSFPKKPDTFSTSWNPKDINRSVHRARIFTLQSFLGWAVESLEMYLTELNRKPKELESEVFTSLFSQAGQSVFRKVTLIGDEIKVDPVLIALMEVLITWRNYTFHYDIDNEIRQKSLHALNESRSIIMKDYCGLDVSIFKSAWQHERDFTFKETASLINATHKFVDAVDAYAIRSINIEDYIYVHLLEYFKSRNDKVQKARSLPSGKKERYLSSLIENIIGIKSDEINEEIFSSVHDRLKAVVIN